MTRGNDATEHVDGPEVDDFLDRVDEFDEALTRSDTGRALAAYRAIGLGLANISARLRTSRTSKAVVVDLTVLRTQRRGGRS